MNVKITGFLLAGALAVLCFGASAVPVNHPLSLQDKDWVKAIHQINLGEIKAGNMAAKMGHSQAVRTAGRRLASAHANLDSRIKQTAHKLNIELPHSLNSNQQYDANELAKKSGTDFDQVWLQSEIGGHEKAIKKTQWEISHGKSPTVKGLAQKALPALEQQLKMLRHASNGPNGG